MDRVEELKIETKVISDNCIRGMFKECKTHEEILAVVNQLTSSTLEHAGIRTKEINRR